MSWQAVEAVLKHSHSKGSARLLLLCIAHHAQPDGKGSRPGVERLAAQTLIDPREVRRLTRKLEVLGELERRQGGGERANEYSLVLPIDASGADTSGSIAPTETGTTGEDTRRGRVNTPSQTTVVETSVVAFTKSTTTLAAELESQGVAASVAWELASRHAERVPLQMACLADRKPKDAAATLVASIRGNWDAPASYRKRLESEARAQSDKASREREAQQQAVSAQQQKDDEQRQSAEAARLDAVFEALSEGEQAAIDAESKERLGVIGRSGKAKGALMAMRRAILKETEDATETNEA